MTGVQTCALPIYLENLIASINATNEANQTLVIPAQRLAKKADKERLAAQEELTKLKNEANTQAQMQRRLEEQEKEAAEKAKRVFGTPEEEFRAATQAGREGLGLEGERIARNAAALAAKENGLRSKIGSLEDQDRKSTRLNSSHIPLSRMPSSA